MADGMGMGAMNDPNMTLHDGLQSNASFISEDQPTKSFYLQVAYWGLASLVILVLCYLSRSSIPDPRHRIAFIARERERRRAEAKKDPEKRNRLIDRSLITKVR